VVEDHLKIIYLTILFIMTLIKSLKNILKQKYDVAKCQLFLSLLKY
jgi:hypothetical protein